jgi:hypothetical protein
LGFFVCLLYLLWVFYLYSYYLFFFLFLYYQLYHHLLTPTVNPFTLPPFPVLKSTALIPNNLFCSFSPTLSPCPHLPLPFFPNLLPDYLPPSHSSPTDQPTIPTLHHPKLLQSLTQAPSKTTTEIHPNTYKDYKTQQPCTASSTHLHLFLPPALVPPYPTPQVCTASLRNINSSNSHCLYVLPPRGLLYNI